MSSVEYAKKLQSLFILKNEVGYSWNTTVLILRLNNTLFVKKDFNQEGAGISIGNIVNNQPLTCTCFSISFTDFKYLYIV